MTATAVPSASVAERFRNGWQRYWFDPVPPERVDVFARILAVIVLFTVFHTDQWAVLHKSAPTAFYRPIRLARLVHLPAPTPTTMTLLMVVLGVSAVWMFTRRAPGRRARRCSSDTASG